MKHLTKILNQAEESSSSATKDAIYAILENIVDRAQTTATVAELIEYVGQLMDELE